MQWLALGLAVYLGGCVLLFVYMLAKLLLGRPMALLVGPATLAVTRPPFRLLAPRTPTPPDYRALSHHLRRAA